MDYAGGVRGSERTGNLNRHIQNLIERKIVAADMIAEGAAFNKFRGDEVAAILLAKIINGKNVRVVECTGRAGLPFQSQHALRAVKPRGQKLQRRLPSES